MNLSPRDNPASVPTIMPRHHEITLEHGEQYSDPFFWLRDDSKSNPDVLDYINRENAYAAAIIEQTSIKKINDDINTVTKGRKPISGSYESSKWRHGDETSSYYYYYDPNGTDSLFRRPIGDETVEEIVLDAEGTEADYSFFEISPKNDYIVYGIDHSGKLRGFT
jgi:oligopeptidase B